MTWLTIVIMVAAALGGGAGILRLLRLDGTLGLDDRLIWSFALGMGVLGWVLFFPALWGMLSGPSLAMTCALCLPGLAFLHRRGERFEFSAPSRVGYALLAAIGTALGFDFIEALAPPADGDSLAYHFALPKLFLQAGGLVFIPRANDGAAPFLQQLTYMAALGLGGERAMTLWAMLTGWAAAGTTYSIARRHVDRDWALVAGLAFLTVPAVLYGGGSGQVEPRNAVFVLLAVVAAITAAQQGDGRHAALAGIAAGFYAASKYPGLLFLAVCALPLLLQRHWLRCGVAYGLCALLAGSQWYLWHAWNTGDPVFPMLYGWLPYHEGVPWDAAQHEFYRTAYAAGEKPLSATLSLLFLYPLYATLFPIPAFESQLVGFGPLPLLLLPAALFAVWLRRHSARNSPLVWMAVICFVAYALWFFLGPSLRVRFHLPLYPLLLICLIAGVAHVVGEIPEANRPIVASLVAGLAFQAAVHALFTLNYARYVFSSETRDAFLGRNISFYAAAAWLNANLGPADRVAIPKRELNYLLDVPYFYINSVVDSRIDWRLGPADIAELWQQLRAQGVTYHFADRAELEGNATNPHDAALAALRRVGCVDVAAEIPSQKILSRTLSGGKGIPITVMILKLTPGTCRLSAGSSVRP